MLMPRALEGREDAAAILRQNGARVDDIPVYRTDPCTLSVQDLLPLDGGVDAILFSSSSAVRAWCDAADGGGATGAAWSEAAAPCGHRLHRPDNRRNCPGAGPAGRR